VRIDATENPHTRETIDRVTKRLVDGGMPAETARQVATTSARRQIDGEKGPHVSNSECVRNSR